MKVLLSRLEQAIRTSLCAGFVDLSLTILMNKSPARLGSISSLLESLSATVVVIFLLSVILQGLLNDLLQQRKFTADLVGAFVFTFLCFVVPLNHTVYPLFVPKSSIGPVFWLLVALAFSVSICTIYTLVQETQSGQNIRRLYLAAPFILAESMLALWIRSYRPELLPAIPLGLLYSGTVSATIWFFHAADTDRPRPGAVAVLWLLIPIGLIGLPIFQKQRIARLYETKAEKHAIRHIILITIDTLRADALSCYKSQEAETPNLDQLAAESILFANAFAPSSWTLPSLISVMTGHSPLVHQCYQPGSLIPASTLTLAQMLQNAGYYSGAIVSNTMLNKDISRGFYESFLYPRPKRDGSLGTRILNRVFPAYEDRKASASELTNIATSWISQNSDKDFFLWLHYPDPQLPYDPPRRFLKEPLKPAINSSAFRFDSFLVRSGKRRLTQEEKQSLRISYKGEVLYVDEQLGKLVNELKRANLYDETLLIVTSDHGEEFWEHKGFEHGHSLFQEILRVPLIIKLPFARKALRLATPVSNESILPTVMETIGLPIADEDLRSKSLNGLWQKENEERDEPVISVSTLFYEPRVSVQFDSYKYIRFWVTGREELYDLAKDPLEFSNISQDVEIITRARAILRSRQEKARSIRQRLGIQNTTGIVDEETKRMVESEGYTP